jgi:asparagine synthase (glutamine-hydrolysing)
MCGIAGVYDYRAPGLSQPDVLDSMLGVIQHRGPDDEGRYLDDGLAMGMRRLSIIDLVGGKQPIYNEDRSVVVVFNGEIYNHLDVRRDLERRGHTFATHSDTESIIHLYEEYGDDCVQHMRGMFAFAVWDIRKRRLFIARDRVGIKPLYYSDSGGRLVFGSEIKAILKYPGIKRRMRLDALSHFLTLRYVPAPLTLFEGIVALPPGHTIVCDEEGVTVSGYWDITFNPPEPGDALTEEEYAEELTALLRESVEMRLMSDVPFGAFLSGGVDSSTIVALMSEFLDEPVKTFAVGYSGPGEEMSELPYARMVADRYGTDHQEVLVGPQDFTNHLEAVVWHLDQPIADVASLATYVLSHRAAQDVKMVLTGEGGDELFAGYARYEGEQWSSLFRYIPQPVLNAAFMVSDRLPGLRRQKLALYALSLKDEVTRMTNWFPMFNQDAKTDLLSKTSRHRLGDTSTTEVLATQLAKHTPRDRLNRMLYLDTKLWLVDDLLARGDKTSMAASLEARVPFLDHRLIEFAASLPVDMKLRRNTRKYLLKKVSSRLLPHEIIARPKRGFPIPMAEWCRGDARTFVRDTLSKEAILRRGLFDWESVDTLVRQNENGFADHGLQIWGLMSVEIWHRLFIDK